MLFLHRHPEYLKTNPGLDRVTSTFLLWAFLDDRAASNNNLPKIHDNAQREPGEIHERSFHDPYNPAYINIGGERYKETGTTTAKSIMALKGDTLDSTWTDGTGLVYPNGSIAIIIESHFKNTEQEHKDFKILYGETRDDGGLRRKVQIKIADTKQTDKAEGGSNPDTSKKYTFFTKDDSEGVLFEYTDEYGDKNVKPIGEVSGEEAEEVIEVLTSYFTITNAINDREMQGDPNKGRPILEKVYIPQ